MKGIFVVLVVFAAFFWWLFSSITGIKDECAAAGGVAIFSRTGGSVCIDSSVVIGP